MENFLKPFVEKGVLYSLENIFPNADDGAELNFIRVLEKIVFKHDVVIEFKQILDLVFSPEPFTVKNEIVKKVIQQLHLLLVSDDDIREKIDVFCYILQSFASFCKGDDNVHAIKFFIVLSHLLGVNEVLSISKNNEVEDCSSILNVEHFSRAFEVDIPYPSSVPFSIFKELLSCLSKLSVNFNSTELQVYSKWLRQLIKNLAYFEPFQNVFLEIFSICADIDLQLLEGNLDHIFHCVLVQKPPFNGDFCDCYSIFLERALKVCSMFQKTVKFITKLQSNIKIIPTLLTREVILPSNVINEFAKIVAVASNQQSLAIFDVLVQNLDECFDVTLENNLGADTLPLFVSKALLISFFKEVKLFAPSISSKTLRTFIDKLNIFKGTLQKFGTKLFKNKISTQKNEDLVNTFMELCIYYGEVEVIINCYKDSVFETNDATIAKLTECDWHCCISSKQWENLINTVLKLKLEDLSPMCFQLALQKCRHCKLQNFSDVDDSTIKILMYQLTSNFKKFNIYQQLSPEDLTILMEILSLKQCKSICRKIFKRLLEDDSKTESAFWVCNPQLQENPLFVMTLFSQSIKEVALMMNDLIPEKVLSKVSWLSDDYFDVYYNVLNDKVDKIAENVNFLLKNGKKVSKYLNQSSEQQKLLRVVEVLKLLPLPWMKDDRSRLGLGFLVFMAVLLSEDESSVRSPLESICSFLTSDVDASTCFDVGLFVRWLSELSYSDKKVNDVRVKVIEVLVKNCPNMKFGLKQMGEMIEETETTKNGNQMKMLESRIILHNELGKCWQRAKKRKSDNDLIGNYRTKLAKIISDEAKQLSDSEIHNENSKILLKILAIELNRAIKTNEEKEISILMKQKFPSHFEFAVNSLKRNFDEASAMFLTVVLQSMSHIRKFLPENSFFKSWKALRFHEKVNWKLFCNYSTEEEFEQILNDLLKISKKFINSEKFSSNLFEIWTAFFEGSTESKKNNCQLRVQLFFTYIHNCDLLLKHLPIRKKIFLVKFCSFCVSKKEVILTSHMLDTIIHIMLECLEDDSSLEDFASLFATEVETSSFILLRQFDWSRSKVHLTFVLFGRMLASLMKRCEAAHEKDREEVFKLSTCAFCMEKWTSFMIKREKDFARTTPYFITALVFSVASVTVIPAIKIHLVNCINHFLSISDSHTVSYLMRILKPGYQQVFSNMYKQFKKYHKYSGKI